MPNYQTTPNVSYFYDNLTNAKGKLTKVSSSVSTTEYTAFDILGRVTAHKQTTDGNAYTTGYVYNLSGALIEETYPSTRKVRNTLDADGDLAQVQSQKTPTDILRNYANSFVYTAASAVSSLRLGNGRFENTQFNSRLQPTLIGLGSSVGNTSLLKLDYTYNTPNVADNNGNVKSQTITVPTIGANTGFTAIQNYTYDSLNRLKSAVENITGQTPPSWKQTFTYDRYGNRNFDMANTTIPVPGCPVAVCNPTIDPVNNRLIGYVFDNAGNTTTDANGQVFTYDAENKQVQVNNATGIVGQYFYDGDGKRIKKYVPSTGETTIFVYDASGKSIAEYSTIVANSTDAKVNYLTSDHLGSPRINTDQNGAVIARHDYHPFGEEISTSQRTAGLNYAADSVRKQFTGYERDKETELDFAQARMYLSTLGRFASPDPQIFGALTEPSSWHKYQYSFNNPLLYSDRSGRFPDKIHELITRVAFPGLSNGEVQKLVWGNHSVDVTHGIYPGTVMPWNSYQHVMTSDFYPTEKEARSAMEGFISENIAESQRIMRNPGEETGHMDPNYVLGKATHPVQDNISTEHRNFQYFSSPTVLGGALQFAWKMWGHSVGESQITSYQFQQAVDATREIYRRARPEDYNRAVPAAFEGAWYIFRNGRTDGTAGPNMIDVGKIAEVTVHADGRSETRCIHEPCPK